MKKFKKIVFIAILSVILLPFFLYSAERRPPAQSVAGQKIVPPRPVQWVTIIGHQENGKFVSEIEPFPKLRLERFTRVIWVNNAEVPVLIRIGSGKTCKEASEEMFLYLGTEFLMARCYITQKPLPPGGVMQTEFKEQGRFDYEVEYVGENLRETGALYIY